MNPKDWPALPRRCGCPEQYKGLDCPACRGSGMIPPDAAPLRIRLRDTAAALQPFAAMLQPHHDALPDDRPLFAINGAQFTVGDLRNARAILAQLKMEGMV